MNLLNPFQIIGNIVVGIIGLGIPVAFVMALIGLKSGLFSPTLFGCLCAAVVVTLIGRTRLASRKLASSVAAGYIVVAAISGASMLLHMYSWAMQQSG